MPDSTEDTLLHIEKVQARMLAVQHNIMRRSFVHDESKLHQPEKAILDAKHGALADLRYGTLEYAAAMAAVDIQPFLEHHYAHNDHHPQHYPNGVAGMSLMAILEMLCGWHAAGDRTKQGSIMASLEHNRVRFGIGDQLYSILVNTVKELRW